MRICQLIDLEKDGKVITTLRVYFEGSGNPADEHSIAGLSIGGYGIGKVDTPGDKLEEETWIL